MTSPTSRLLGTLHSIMSKVSKCLWFIKKLKRAEVSQETLWSLELDFARARKLSLTYKSQPHTCTKIFKAV